MAVLKMDVSKLKLMLPLLAGLTLGLVESAAAVPRLGAAQVYHPSAMLPAGHPAYRAAPRWLPAPMLRRSAPPVSQPYLWRTGRHVAPVTASYRPHPMAQRPQRPVNYPMPARYAFVKPQAPMAVPAAARFRPGFLPFSGPVARGPGSWQPRPPQTRPMAPAPMLASNSYPLPVVSHYRYRPDPRFQAPRAVRPMAPAFAGRMPLRRAPMQQPGGHRFGPMAQPQQYGRFAHAGMPYAAPNPRLARDFRPYRFRPQGPAAARISGLRPNYTSRFAPANPERYAPTADVRQKTLPGVRLTDVSAELNYPSVPDHAVDLGTESYYDHTGRRWRFPQRNDG